MKTAESRNGRARWYLIPLRVLLITFPLTLLSFAVSLLFGILGIILRAWMRGAHPSLDGAYRHVALPVAIGAAVVALVLATTIEVRRYRTPDSWDVKS